MKNNQLWIQVRLLLLPPNYNILLHDFHYIYYYYYGSTVLCWALANFSVSSSYTQSLGLLGRGMSPSQSLYLHAEQHKHRINAHDTDNQALCGIRTYDPSVRRSEDSSCLRTRGHCDRFHYSWSLQISELLIKFHSCNESTGNTR
jgi:hypothetical protein